MKKKIRNCAIVLIMLFIAFYALASSLEGTMNIFQMKGDTVKSMVVSWLMVSACIIITTFTQRDKHNEQ